MNAWKIATIFIKSQEVFESYYEGSLWKKEKVNNLKRGKVYGSANIPTGWAILIPLQHGNNFMEHKKQHQAILLSDKSAGWFALG